MTTQTFTRDPRLTNAPAGSAGRTLRATRMSWRSVGADLTYLGSGCALSLFSFLLLVPLFTLGATTAVLWVGIPLTGFMLLTATGFARENRELLRRWGRPVAEPAYRGRRPLTMLGDPKAWLEALHGMLIAFPVRLTAFLLPVSWFAGALGGLTWFLWGHFLPQDEYSGLAWLLTTVLELDVSGSWYLWESLTMAVAGLLLLVTAPVVTRVCAVTEATVTRALVGPFGTVTGAEGSR